MSVVTVARPLISGRRPAVLSRAAILVRPKQLYCPFGQQGFAMRFGAVPGLAQLRTGSSASFHSLRITVGTSSLRPTPAFPDHAFTLPACGDANSHSAKNSSSSPRSRRSSLPHFPLPPLGLDFRIEAGAADPIMFRRHSSLSRNSLKHCTSDLGDLHFEIRLSD
jgi:hypothetical protein